MDPATPAPQDDVRPLVARPVNNRAAWIFGGVLAIAAIGLFSTLEARRSGVVSPATAPALDYGPGVIAPPPALAIPGGYAELDPSVPAFATMIPPRNAIPYTLPGVPTAPRAFQPGYIPGPPIVRPPVFVGNDPDSVNYRPPVATGPTPPDLDALPANSLAGGRARAGRFANPATTVPQGAVIQAVLETALDSNRPGFARAIVSRDVRSFDGSHVLIPRGSRLFGEYKSDLGQGQNRAFIQWQRLTRPDGVQIAIDSPAADPLGRAGVKGSVNSHFLARFGAAILQSTLDIGVGLATSQATNGTVILGLPGSTQQLVQPNSESVRPTLKVPQGTSVSVFVARDLDFTSVEQ
ncbi:MAG TPA: TrbI/VirB10 family protein [Novosphingobium sp.]|nr:TrbI/VirB10 family protein [Novosphingobium sp.]